ncbi:MAG: hypothetical protein MUF34_04515 [Polyangiaceae bacterium]|nr:hypothetical protein [Polyangiaceae bacterium]
MNLGPARQAARAAGVVFALLASAQPSRAAPVGPGTEGVAVLGLEADLSNDHAAKTLTNALRQQVLDSSEFTLAGLSPPLVAKAVEARCALRGMGLPLGEASDLALDGPCLKRLAARLKIARYFWGHLYNERGRPLVKLHLWQEGQPDRSVTLPYDDGARERLAERLYRKLVTPDKVGDVTLSGGGEIEGELYVDGKPQGRFVTGVELTLPVGKHAVEIRAPERIVAATAVSIAPGARDELRLEAIAALAPSPSPAPPRRPNPPPPREGAGPLPWVLGGIGAAGLVGAGVFFGLYQGQKSDLERACVDRRCPAERGDDIERANRYGALSLVSLGVGVAGGVGLLTYRFVWPRRMGSDGAQGASWVGSLLPLSGGAAASITGGF